MKNEFYKIYVSAIKDNMISMNDGKIDTVTGYKNIIELVKNAENDGVSIDIEEIRKEVNEMLLL